MNRQKQVFPTEEQIKQANADIKSMSNRQKWLVSKPYHIWRSTRYFFGFSQCRHCVYFQSEKKEKYRTLRDSILLLRGQCSLALESTSTSYLDDKDIDAMRRCPAFVPILFNAKGYALDSSKIEEIQARRKGFWDRLFQFGGWIVAAIALFVSVLSYQQSSNFFSLENQPNPIIQFNPQGFQFKVVNQGKLPLTNIEITWAFAWLAGDKVESFVEEQEKRGVLHPSESFLIDVDDALMKQLNKNSGVYFLTLVLTADQLSSSRTSVFYMQTSEKVWYHTDGSLWGVGEDQQQLLKEKLSLN